MSTIPAAAFDDMFKRFGHTLYEYDGLAEALYAHEQETKKAAPVKERPRVAFGFRMSLPPRRVVQPVAVGALFRKPANRA
jgi:hypothetical protein